MMPGTLLRTYQTQAGELPVVTALLRNLHHSAAGPGTVYSMSTKRFRTCSIDSVLGSDQCGLHDNCLGEITHYCLI